MPSFVIIEWNQASHQPRLAFEDVYDDQHDAVELAREQLRRNRAVGRRESFSVHDLGEMVWRHEDDAHLFPEFGQVDRG